MELIYRNRKHITRIALIPLVFILLLASNFKIWSGTNSYHGLEVTIDSQSILLDHGILSNNRNSENANNTGFIGVIVACVLLPFVRFTWKYKIKLFCEKRYTLVSLCVRMDE